MVCFGVSARCDFHAIHCMRHDPCDAIQCYEKYKNCVTCNELRDSRIVWSHLQRPLKGVKKSGPCRIVVAVGRLSLWRKPLYNENESMAKNTCLRL